MLRDFNRGRATMSAAFPGGRAALYFLEIHSGFDPRHEFLKNLSQCISLNLSKKI
jgi:hypothetical protein